MPIVFLYWNRVDADVSNVVAVHIYLTSSTQKLLDRNRFTMTSDWGR